MKIMNYKIRRKSDGKILVVRSSVAGLLCNSQFSRYERIGRTDEPRTFSGITATGIPVERS
jgi:hypothetical protein